MIAGFVFYSDKFRDQGLLKMQIIMWLGEEKNESDPGDLLAIGVFLD